MGLFVNFCISEVSCRLWYWRLLCSKALGPHYWFPLFILCWCIFGYNQWIL